MWRQIKSGAWLTRERLRGYSFILIAISVVAAVVWIVLADGLVDRNDKPIGTDFSNVWAAGKLVLDGEPGVPYDPVLQHAAEKEAVRQERKRGGHHQEKRRIVPAEERHRAAA